MPGRYLGGGGGGKGGGGRLAEEVLVFLVNFELQAQVGVASLGLGTRALLRQVLLGRRLHGEEGKQGLEEAGWR